MATWVVHFRIAEYFLNALDVSATEFVAGNVAPDCGYGEKDSMGEFVPPPSVTHWTPTGRKRDCKVDDFCTEYLIGKDCSKPDYSFYLGYYVHLMTDILWSERIYLPTRGKYSEEFENDPGFLKVVKRDWNDLDFKFLYEHPDFKAYEIICSIEKVKDYLPYYEENQLTVQTKFIANFYEEQRDVEHKYKYLSEKDVDEFIKNACMIIEKDIKNKNLAQIKK